MNFLINIIGLLIIDFSVITYLYLCNDPFLAFVIMFIGQFIGGLLFKYENKTTKGWFLVESRKEIKFESN